MSARVPSPRVLWGVLAGTLLVKLLLAATIPFSGDEAYFLIWAKYPDYGFYDHPPMVGWILWLMLRFGDAEWVLRLPVVMITSFVGYGLYRLLADWDEEKARLVAVVYLASPLNLLGVLITTDAPLLLFSFLTLWALVRGLERGADRDFLLAGAAFGLACLSKYFAALLGLALIVYWLGTARGRAHHRGFLLLFLAALPFIAVNLYWNYGHCWANVMFNVFNRNTDAAFGWHKPLLYAVEHLYLMSPFAALLLITRRQPGALAAADGRFGLAAVIFAVPVAVFGVLSFVKVIGLHWLLSFYPAFFLLLAVWLGRADLARLWRFMIYYGGAHVLALAVVLLAPLSLWQGSDKYGGLVLMFRAPALLEQLSPDRRDYLLASDGYSMAAILSYHARQNVVVFGDASSHARHDDIVTDFRALDGRNILVVLKRPPAFEAFGPYFKSIEFGEVKLDGTTFHLVRGQGFDFAAYRERVLRAAKTRYYSVPPYLPMGGCYFCARYFPQEACRPEERR